MYRNLAMAADSCNVSFPKHAFKGAHKMMQASYDAVGAGVGRAVGAEVGAGRGGGGVSGFREIGPRGKFG